MKLDLVDAYTMKCRLYANESQKELIQKALAGVRVYYNCTLFEMFTNFSCTKEKEKKTKDGEQTGEIVHFPDLKLAQSKEWKAKLMSEHPIIESAPAGALMGKNSCIGADMKKSLGKLPVEYQKPVYYSNKHPRMSYTYQETCSKIERSENHNVFYITLNKIGRCKVRGWNDSIRFDEDGALDFLDYCEIDKKKQLTVTISVDRCGDHYICFKLQNVYKPMAHIIGREIGVDVGITNSIVLSDGKVYENKRFKKAEKRNLRRLERKLARQQGWANEEFRAAHKANPEIVPSTGYEKTRLKHARLTRKIERRRANWNHKITRKIVEESGRIGIETLDVMKMFKNKYVAESIADAAIGSIIENIKYKAAWHGREVIAVDKWFPSTKRCSSCGHINENLKLWPRTWRCPFCKDQHDIDVNAAKNIMYAAFYPQLIYS